MVTEGYNFKAFRETWKQYSMVENTNAEIR